jgi:hypothetical protein
MKEVGENARGAADLHDPQLVDGIVNVTQNNQSAALGVRINLTRLIMPDRRPDQEVALRRTSSDTVDRSSVSESLIPGRLCLSTDEVAVEEEENNSAGVLPARWFARER